MRTAYDGDRIHLSHRRHLLRDEGCYLPSDRRNVIGSGKGIHICGMSVCQAPEQVARPLKPLRAGSHNVCFVNRLLHPERVIEAGLGANLPSVSSQSASRIGYQD